MKMLTDIELPEELRALNAARKREHDIALNTMVAKFEELKAAPTIDEQILAELRDLHITMKELLKHITNL
jgi:tRNA A37 threonylcarbamoyladenosine synthetase subunit TsaC/SUA5/YrdC